MLHRREGGVTENGLVNDKVSLTLPVQVKTRSGQKGSNGNRWHPNFFNANIVSMGGAIAHACTISSLRITAANAIDAPCEDLFGNDRER